MNITNYDYECTKKCKSLDHGQKITLVLTKRSIEDESLASYIAKTCRNFAEIKDCFGRTALHIASSVDRYILSEWLLNHGAVINGKDSESGSSVLHRAVFYGCIDCAVLLIRYGANLEILDDDTRIPLHYVCKLNHFRQYDNTPFPNLNEILVWGTNKNYNLGIGNNEGTKTPQFIDFFRKENISIKSAVISSYHSLFLDAKDNLYAVGHGKTGRLGINSDNSLAVPRKINKLSIRDPKIVQLSVSKNHSLILTNKDTVYVCGSNEFKQLGIRPSPEKLLAFREIISLSCGIQLLEVIAKDYYSLAYSSKDMYVWGTNVGQFGTLNNIPEILLPQKVRIPDSSSILQIKGCNYAIAVYTSGKQIHIFYNHKVKVIRPPLLEAVKNFCLVAEDPQKTIKGTSSNPLKLLILTCTNVVYIWYEDLQQYLRCTFAHLRLNEIDKILYNSNQVFILSEGDVYFGKCNKVPLSTAIQDCSSAWHSNQNKKDICTDQKIRIELTKLQNIDRAVDIVCDDDFESFMVLQESSRKYFVLPPLINEEYTFKKLLNDANEFDSIHDLVFHVENEIFYAHKFIIFSRSRGLKSIVEKFQDKDIYLNLRQLTGKMFELILKHIYTNYFLTCEDIDDVRQSLGPSYDENQTKLCELFSQFSEKFLLNDLANNIKSFCKGKSSAKLFDKSKSHFNRLKRISHPALYDVKIKCASNQELQAHKCILVTRLEYFNLMFTHSWAETTTISLTTIPIQYLEPIIDFLYTADVHNFRKQGYAESFLYNMIVICDQFFINRLRKVCEILVLEKISIRKCGEMLEFAEVYNCAVLKRGCMDFICQNLSRVLSQRSLEVCEPSTLKNLNEHYRHIFKDVFDFRQITPDSEAIKDAELLSFIEGFTVDLDYRIQDDLISKNLKKVKTKESKTILDKRNYEKEAISNQLRELNLENLTKKEDMIKKRESEKETLNADEKLHAQSVSWLKVHDKKEPKKKLPAGVVNANNILKSEEKPKEEFISLSHYIKSQTISDADEKISGKSGDENEKNLVNRQSLNFGDFTPLKNEKLSQKQRKRLSSDTTKPEAIIQSPTTSTKPIEIPERSNVWGVITSPSSVSDQEFSSSFANIIKSPQKPKKLSFSESPEKTCLNQTSNVHVTPTSTLGFRKSTGAISKQSPKAGPSNFNEILEEEKRQKDYYEKMRSKSLVLTQIEEVAIAELREFYNVNNCEDEIISIGRRAMPHSMNFAVWQKK